MNIASKYLVATVFLMASLPRGEAHCLVFRAKFVSSKRSTDTSASTDDPSLPPPTKTMLMVVDLEKEYQQWSWSSNSALSTENEVIWIDDGISKTFSHGSSKDPGSKAYSGWTKFGFFKTGSYFYLMNVDIEDFGYWGFDYGTFSASGPCTASTVNIGGGNRFMNIPADFVGVQTRADSGEFKTNIGNFSVDSAMTTAVNDYLYLNNFITASGVSRTTGTAGGIYDTTVVTSTMISKATAYLYNTYLPQAGYTLVPQ